MGYIFEKRNRCVERRNEIFDQGFNWEVHVYVGPEDKFGYYYFDNKEEAKQFIQDIMPAIKKAGYGESYMRYQPYFCDHIETKEERHARLMATDVEYANRVHRKEAKLAWAEENPIEAAQKMLKHNQKLLDRAEKDLKATLAEVKRRQNHIAKLQAEIEKNLAVLAGRLA